ncbi:SMP-30/gluconolactonase/LRE family protein [Amylibacter sp. IMCC11727]|uniref:SMP-30/gluconolactonase/LRE family protein n=1 Tax=Amylibacter sp. IMCC11727 TaxID=3039851 RepID=UPI00244DB9E0|nr:SMP-30/gluconolactonase/LRE family protein [Amylibacter sp. IMCC11727]WGI23505.1 SMP-30/gluconolactonase/LRE family protein [Amylibacter sp. IMCC11727]
MQVEVFDNRQCVLGEGPLWHPVRGELFWFDILSKKMMTKTQEWVFEEHVSAAGWIDTDRLLIASETALFTFDLRDGTKTHVVDLDAENPVTRSNDGRADPQGGFWIGTMGKSAEPNAGAIYRYYRGEVRKLFGNITISNSICFAPSGDRVYFTDTRLGKIMTMALDDDGWPTGAPVVFVDVSGDGLNPDGSVVDAEGCLWNAQWGTSRVARYASDGTFLSAVEIPAKQASCPAFGGADLRSLFVTSAADGLSGTDEGKTFAVKMDVQGQAEHQVML